MGNPTVGSERPVREVTLSTFYMDKYPVTQAGYEAVMGRNPSHFKTNPAPGEVQEKRPVESVNWYQAAGYANELSKTRGLTPAYQINGTTVTVMAGSTGYRLATEAQWEYAARGGNGSPGNYVYAGSNSPGDVAWYDANSEGKTHEAGKKAANGLGLYDMSGNVFEWVWDWYGDYPDVAETDPMGASSGTYRILRGGNWSQSVGYATSAARTGCPPNLSDGLIGFRLVRP